MRQQVDLLQEQLELAQEREQFQRRTTTGERRADRVLTAVTWRT